MPNMDACVHRLSEIVNNHLINSSCGIFRQHQVAASFSFYFAEENLKLKKWQCLLPLVSFPRSTHTFKCSGIQREREKKCAIKKMALRCARKFQNIWQFSRQTSKYLIMFSIHFTQTTRPFDCCVIKWACNLASPFDKYFINELTLQTNLNQMIF